MQRFLLLVVLFCCCQSTDETLDIVEPEIEETSVYETVPVAATTLKPAEDWQHVVRLKRNNRSPEGFNVIDEDIDPLVEAYVAGKDFLFVVGKDRKIVKSYYYFDQPVSPEIPRFDADGNVIPEGIPPLQHWFWKDPQAWWIWAKFDWTRRQEVGIGFGVSWDVSPVPINRFGERSPDRKYLFAPNIGITVENVYIVGLGTNSEIETDDIYLDIYIR